MLTIKEVFILRKLQIGDEAEEDALDVFRALVERGFAEAPGKTDRRKSRITTQGLEAILTVRHGEAAIACAIADGYFDHLSLSTFVTLVESPDLEHYIHNQVRVRAITTSCGGRYGATLQNGR